MEGKKSLTGNSLNGKLLTGKLSLEALKRIRFWLRQDVQSLVRHDGQQSILPEVDPQFPMEVSKPSEQSTKSVFSYLLDRLEER